MSDAVQVGSGSGPSQHIRLGHSLQHHKKGQSLDITALHMALLGDVLDPNGGVSSKDIMNASVGGDVGIEMINGFGMVGYISKQVTPLKLWNVVVHRDWDSITADLENLLTNSGTPDGRPRTVAENMVASLLKRIELPERKGPGNDWSLYERESWWRNSKGMSTKRTKQRWDSVWICYCGIEVWRTIRKDAGRSDAKAIF